MAVLIFLSAPAWAPFIPSGSWLDLAGLRSCRYEPFFRKSPAICRLFYSRERRNGSMFPLLNVFYTANRIE